jgi:hypothetical protein
MAILARHLAAVTSMASNFPAVLAVALGFLAALAGMETNPASRPAELLRYA